MKKVLTTLLSITFVLVTHSQVNYKAQIFYIKNILKPTLSQPYRNIEYRMIEDGTMLYNSSNSFSKKVLKNKNEISFLDNYFSQKFPPHPPFQGIGANHGTAGGCNSDFFAPHRFPKAQHRFPPL